MTIRLYEKTTADQHNVLLLFVAGNLALALLTVLAWDQVAPWFEPAILWATGQVLGPQTPHLFKAPFVYFWIVPGIGGLASWALARLEAASLAWPIAVFPLAYALFIAVGSWLEAGS
jgi:hypothetical protein